MRLTSETQYNYTHKSHYSQYPVMGKENLNSEGGGNGTGSEKNWVMKTAVRLLSGLVPSLSHPSFIPLLLTASDERLVWEAVNKTISDLHFLVQLAAAKGIAQVCLSRIFMAAPGMCKCVYPNLFHNINTLIALTDLCSSISPSANGETRKISILQSKAYYKLKIISFLFALHHNGCHIIVVNSSTLLIGPDLSLSLFSMGKDSQQCCRPYWLVACESC